MKKGTCRHFNGVGVGVDDRYEKCCDAGINYRKHVGGKDLGWACRMPCIKGGYTKPEEVVPCDLYEEPTQEDIDKHEAGMDAHINRIMMCMPLIERIKKEHKGESWRGTEECPVCQGVLHLTHASCNGHVWGKCETKGCASWIE